jgi:Mg-chelatase subunit ChlI
MRLASDPTGFGLVPAGQAYTPGRRLNVTSSVSAARTADDVLDELDQMVGLGPVKEEVNKLLAGIEVERKRRELGLPMPTVSRHMVFTGPPGVGKTQIARALGEIYRSLNVLRGGQPRPRDGHRGRLPERDAALHRLESGARKSLQQNHRFPALHAE